MSDQVYYHSYLNRDRLVHIFDADLAVCENLSVLFRLEGFQTRYSQDIESFRKALDQRVPDVVILEMERDAQFALTLLRHVKNLRMGTPVFMLAKPTDLDGAVEAMKLGATDVIGKPIDSEKLTRAVRDALRRDVHLGAVQGGRRPVEIRGFNQLTQREREVLQLISNGQSNKEAGRDLGISPRTIEVHRARVMEKLGARNTADLMRIVLTS